MVRILLIFATVVVSLTSCDMMAVEEQGEGRIVLSVQPPEQLLKSGAVDGINIELAGTLFTLDTNNFILKILDSNGGTIYSGKYSERPEEIIVTPGSYDIKLHSINFKEPAFSTPLFGDEQTVLVENGKTIYVDLNCRQLNAGLKLIFSESFNKRYAFGVRLRDEYGERHYAKTVTEYCYFLPGAVEMVYKEDNADTVLMSRVLEAGQMLSLILTYSENSMYNVSNIKITIDTTRIWAEEKYNTALKIPYGVFSIEEAKQRVGEKDLPIFGFILGGDATEKTMRIAPPFSSSSHIVIAPSMLERNRNNCFVVELPSGKVRDALNLVSNRSLLGSPIVIVGDVVESYYGYIGVRRTDSYTIL